MCTSHDQSRPHTRMQDIVNEDSAAIDMETFLPLLQERVYSEDPNNRQFIVSWIQVCVTCICDTIMSRVSHAVHLQCGQVGGARRGGDG